MTESINELKSYTEYNVNTPRSAFTIGFPYEYNVDEVHVYVNGVEATTAGYTVAHVVQGTLTLTPAVPSGVVRIMRETDIDTSAHTFSAGAKFTAKNMDENFQQIRHSQQEVRDGLTHTKSYLLDVLHDYDDRVSTSEGLVNTFDARLNNEVAERTQGDLDSQRYVEDLVGMGQIWDGVSSSAVQDYARNKSQAQVNDDLYLEVANGRVDGAIETWSGRTQEDKNKEFISVCDYGMVGDYATSNDTAWASILASGRKYFFVPEGVYRFDGTINIPNDFILIGAGNPVLGFGTADDKMFIVDGSKTNLRGSVFVGSGTGTTYTTSDRSDSYATVKPLCRIYERSAGATGVRIQGLGILQDMNCYDSGGNAIPLESSGIATGYDVGLYLDDTSRGVFDRVTVFGYFTKAGTCIQSKSGNDDPDYNTFTNCMTTGRHGVAILGADVLEASYGLSSSRFINTGIYTLDHHSRGTMTAPQREAYYNSMFALDAKCLYIDGNVNAASAEINGHYFDKCEIRTRFDYVLKLDHASNIQFSQCVFEYAPYNTITYSSGTPKFVGTTNVKRGISFLQCRMNYTSMIFNSTFAGLIPVKITIVGDPLNGRMATVGAVGGGTWTIAMLGSDGNIGDASFQLTTDVNNGSSGWKMLRKASTDAFQITKEGTSLLQMLPTGVTSISYPTGTDAYLGLLGYGGADSWFLRTQNSSVGQLQFRPTVSGGDVALQVSKTGVITSSLSGTTATVGATSAIYSAMYAAKYMFTSTVGVFAGSGSPEGVLTAGIGSTYHRTDGGAGTSFYVKESGTGNTGWVAK